MQLLFLLLLLVGPYLILQGRDAILGRDATLRRPPVNARIGLTLFFGFTGIGHFIKTAEMVSMLPPSVPYRLELVYATGILELIGAICVWVPRLRRITGIALILLLIGILPANIYSALNHVNFGGHEAGPIYLLVRIPFQLFTIWWTYVATEQR